MEKIISVLALTLCCLFCSQINNAQTQYWFGPDDDTGIWNHTNKNWEGASGEKEAWANGMAIFSKEERTVTLESTQKDPLYFQTLRFLSDYTLSGGFLAIRNAEDNNNGRIHVDSKKKVEIASTLMNGGAINALFKQGKGTLILSGTNLHTGGTFIEEGQLWVSKDQNLGASNAPLVMDNGLLNIKGNDFDVTDRITHLTGANCSIRIEQADHTLTFTKLFDIKTSFYKDGPGTLIVPIRSAQSGSVTILEGTMKFSNTELEVADFMATEVKERGTLIMEAGKDAWIRMTDLTGRGNIEKRGKGTLVLNGPNRLTGEFLHKGGNVFFPDHWYSSYEQEEDSKSRLETAADIYFQGNVTVRDTIVTAGTLNILGVLKLDNAVVSLKAGHIIKLENNLKLEGRNTLLLEEEHQLPLSLMKVRGSHPTNEETNNGFQIKVGEKLLKDPNYVFTWYENELFLRDKTQPFPLKYTVELEVSPEIESDRAAGLFTFTRGESFVINFNPLDFTTPKEAISFLVNEKETEFRTIGNSRYSYRISEVTQDYTIRIGLKKFTFSGEIPKGVSVSPTWGEELGYGDEFSFTITLDEEYNQSDVRLYVNGKYLEAESKVGDVLTYRILSVTDNIKVRILGVTENDPTGTEQILSDAPLFRTENEMLMIELQNPEPVAIYSITGKLCADIPASVTYLSVPLKRGIYLVKVGAKAHKVIVR